VGIFSRNILTENPYQKYLTENLGGYYEPDVTTADQLGDRRFMSPDVDLFDLYLL
jgi:hypothetical protein